jgi:phosphate starvation-inducible PhoH-like protein
LDSSPHTASLTLEPYDARRLATLCGRLDENIRQIERRLDVEIRSRGNEFRFTGEAGAVSAAARLVEELYANTADSDELSPDEVHLHLREAIAGIREPGDERAVLRTRRGWIKPRGDNQRRYVERILDHDISFGIGPAGTGKTYLAVAAAVDSLERDEVRRILLVRPAVEAGEKLGFLPGDLAEKINPYLRPLYDALYEMLGFERVAKLLDRQVIEVAPLAYMRGRTLNNSFIILDESQNTTREQMKMFLTRIGFGSKAVITGDITQVDLPRGTESGLVDAMHVLDNVPGIAFTRFESVDVVRHTLVQRIVEAYDRQDAARGR